jgi:hypothetical protein
MRNDFFQSIVIRFVVKSRFVKTTFIILALFLSSFVPSAFGQVVADEPYKIPSNSSGEENSALTDGIAIEARESGERLFVIVRLGKGESSRLLNQSRLMNTKSYMLRKGFTSKSAVFAEGVRVKGEGRIEYYLGSKLKLITLAPRNKMPKLNCCDDYMPPVKKKLKRKKRRG